MLHWVLACNKSYPRVCGMMEKKMETTIMGFIGCILGYIGLYRDIHGIIVIGYILGIFVTKSHCQQLLVFSFFRP